MFTGDNRMIVLQILENTHENNYGGALFLCYYSYMPYNFFMRARRMKPLSQTDFLYLHSAVHTEALVSFPLLCKSWATIFTCVNPFY